MDNLKLPAYPANIMLDDKQNTYVSSSEMLGEGGLTKLELASLMIAQGFMSGGEMPSNDSNIQYLSQKSVSIAKAVLEEANK